VAISARTGQGIDRLVERIGQVLRPRMVRTALLIPYRDGPALALCYERGRVLRRVDDSDGIRVEVELPRHLVARVEGYRAEA
jgi:GTPase